MRDEVDEDPDGAAWQPWLESSLMDRLLATQPASPTASRPVLARACVATMQSKSKKQPLV